MFTKAFWKDAAERAVKTAGQTFLALVGAGTVGLFHLPWANIGEGVAGAVVLSVVTSLISSGVGSNTNASVVNQGE
jgi:hypothetical protein